MLRGGKGMRRVSPEQSSLTTAAQAAANSSTAQDLQETITIQARAMLLRLRFLVVQLVRSEAAGWPFKR